MKMILVTGGAGYVGSVLIRKLLRNGYAVTCLDILMHGGDSLIDIYGDPNFTFHKCDISINDEINSVLKKNELFGIVHLASIVGDPACKANPDLAKKINLDASKFLLEKCIEHEIPKFIFASTCSNYGKMKDPDSYVDENSELKPVSLYAELKVAFEQYLLTEIPKIDSFSPTSLRFSTIYGMSPRMRFDLTVNEFTKELVLGKKLIVYGENFWRPYCHVDDISNAIMTVLNSPKEKVAYNVYNVGDTNENYTKKMIVQQIQKYIPQGEINYIEKDEDPRDYRVSFDKIKNILNFNISKKLTDGIGEIKEALTSGVISDPEDPKYYNIIH